MMMDRWTRALLGVIAVCLSFLCVRSLQQPRSSVHAASSALQFSADKDHFYFFDPASQKIYTYAVVGGHVKSIVRLDGVGQDLRPVATY